MGDIDCGDCDCGDCDCGDCDCDCGDCDCDCGHCDCDCGHCDCNDFLCYCCPCGVEGEELNHRGSWCGRLACHLWCHYYCDRCCDFWCDLLERRTDSHSHHRRSRHQRRQEIENKIASYWDDVSVADNNHISRPTTTTTKTVEKDLRAVERTSRSEYTCLVGEETQSDISTIKTQPQSHTDGDSGVSNVQTSSVKQSSGDGDHQRHQRRMPQQMESPDSYRALHATSITIEPTSSLALSFQNQPYLQTQTLQKNEHHGDKDTDSFKRDKNDHEHTKSIKNNLDESLPETTGDRRADKDTPPISIISKDTSVVSGGKIEPAALSSKDAVTQSHDQDDDGYHDRYLQAGSQYHTEPVSLSGNDQYEPRVLSDNITGINYPLARPPSYDDVTKSNQPP